MIFLHFLGWCKYQGDYYKLLKQQRHRKFKSWSVVTFKVLYIFVSNPIGFALVLWQFSSNILWYLSSSFQPKKKKKSPARCWSCMEVMIPTVLGLCLPWLITLTILTRQTFIKLRSLQRAHGTAVQRAGTSSASPVPSGREAGVPGPLLHGLGLRGHLVTAQLLLQPLSGMEGLPGHPCPQQGKMYCC